MPQKRTPGQSVKWRCESRMMIRKSVLVPLGVTVSLLVMVFVCGVYLLQERHLQRKTRTQVTEAQRLFCVEVDDDARVLHSLVDALETDQRMRQAWAIRDREALLACALPVFRNLRSQYGVTHFYVHDLDKTCFLRVHEPSRRGDRINRFTLTHAAACDRPVHGIELGPLGTFALRVVHPWSVDGQRVGYIELGEEIGHLTQKVQHILGDNLVFFVRKSFLDRPQWEVGMGMLGRTPNWDEFPDHVVVDSTLPGIPPEMGRFLTAAELDSGYTADLVHDQRAYRCGFSPLVDAEGRELGRIAAIVDTGEEWAHLRKVTGTAGVIGMLIIAGWCGGTYAYLRRVELRLLAAYTAQQREVEQRCRTEDTLRESQEQYRILTDSSLTGIFIQQDDRYVFTNARFAEMHGYTVDELIGKCYLSLIHPEEHARVQQNVARRLAGLDVQQQYEMRRMTKDGRTIWCTVIASRIVFRGEPAIMGNIIDITDRKQMEQKLDLMRHLVDQSNDSIFAIDMQNGRFLEVNEGACRNLGYAREELLQMRVQDIEGRLADDNLWCEHAVAVRQAGAAVFDGLHCRRHGASFPVNVSVKHVVHEERDYILATARDVTQQKLAEKRILDQLRFVETLLDTIPNPVFYKDVDGRYTGCNRAFETLLGLSRQQIIGKSVFEVAPVEIAEQYHRKDQELLEERGRQTYELRVRDGQGQLRDVVFTKTTIEDAEGRVTGLIGTAVDITERKRMEETLRESEQTNRAILDNIGIGISMIAPDMRVLAFNRQMRDWFPQVDLVEGPNCYRAFNWPPREEACPNCPTLKTLQDGTIHEGISETSTRDGVRFYRIVASPLFDSAGRVTGAIEMMDDITEQRRNEERLCDSEARLRAITDSAQDAILMMDAQGRVCYWNPAAERILGYQNDEAIGQDLHQLIAPNRYHEAHAAAFPEFQRSGRGKAIGKTLELAALRKDGQEITVALSLSPVHIHGGWHAIGIVRDVTAQKQAEEMLRHAKEEAEQSKEMLQSFNHQLEEAIERANLMAQEAVVANQAKSEFLANMSHEIRTPMNGIVGFSNMLGDSSLTQEQRQYVDTIRDCAHNLLQIINDVLDFSKIEARRMTVEYVDCSLAKLLAGIESLMAPKARGKGLDFEVIVGEPAPPARIRTDPIRLRQCLINLVNNATKFTERGSVRLCVSLEEIAAEPFVRFDVVDTGIGIPEDRQRAIFEAFVQADGSTTRKYGGTGLGLAITKQLMELLGGRIGLKSKPDQGATFSLIVPARVDLAGQPRLSSLGTVTEEEASRPMLEEPRFQGRVLVAEDIAANQLLMRLMLERLGVSVTSAKDGERAVTLALEDEFNLIFMDIQMPRKNGHEATRELRRRGVTTPIVALTAHAMETDRQDCLASGCNDYLSKPVERKELMKMLDKYVPHESRLHEPDTSRDSDPPQGDDDTATSQGTAERRAIIAWDRLIDRLVDEKTVLEVMPVYVEENRRRLEELNKAVSQSDAAQVKLYAHGIKGASANVGAVELSEAAKTLEHLAADGDLSDAPRILQEINRLFQEFQAFVARPDWIHEIKQQQKPECVPVSTSGTPQ